MAKDYFQDIRLSPDDASEPKRSPQRRPALPRPPRKEKPEPIRLNVRDEEAEEEEVEVPAEEEQPARSIRNVSLPTRPTRQRIDVGEPRGSFGGGPILPPRRPSYVGPGGGRASRMWLWVIVVICLLVIAGVLLVVTRPTTVTVTPRSHSVTFDSSSQFTTFPVATAATGTLTYTVVTQTLNASQSVASNGMQEVQQKASGTITVYNNYSTTPQHLIANTRFETPDGLVFRIGNAITIPGKTASGPGQISTTVTADQTGPTYNVGPVSHFTVPGLQSSATQYADIYAVSTAPMTGGFSGEKPGVSPTDESNAVNALQSQLQKQADQLAQQYTSASTTALAGLEEITYQELPETAASSSNDAEINEGAQVQLPVFPASLFASTVAQSVSADVGASPVTLVPGSGFGASFDNASSTSLGTDQLDFSLSGSAQIIWQVDTGSLARSLAGKDQGAFTTIVNSFPGVQQASARIEPFWKSTFPTDPADIKIVLEAPQSS